MSKFKNGNIMSLYVKNFQTFTEQNFSFGSSLNFIAAPNGSGKSSIANAIAFAFNGSPKTIGKSKDIFEFIKFGCNSCEISATVFFEGENIVMTRKISHNTNNFYINSSLVTQKDYFEFCKKLKVDINNLCTFLPQERVGEFCRMDSKELLIEVLKSSDISLTKINEMYDNLTEITSLMDTAEKKKKIVSEGLNHLEIKMRDFKENEAIQEKVQKLKYKKERTEFLALKSEYLNYKKQLKTSTDKIQDINKRIEVLTLKIQDNEENEAFVNHKINVDQLYRQNENILKIDENIKKIVMEIEILKNEVEKLLERIKRHEKEVYEKEKQLESFRKEVLEADNDFTQQMIKFKNHIYQVCSNEDLADYVDLNPKFQLENPKTLEDLDQCLPSFKKIDRKIMDLGLQLSQIQNVSKDIQVQLEDLTREKISCENQDSRRLELLKKYHSDTYKGVLWLRENKNMFKSEVFEPSYLHITIDPEYTDYVETFLSFQSLSSFIVQNDDDFTLLTNECKDKLNYSINVAMHSPCTTKSIPKKDLDEIGLDGVLTDFIQCRSEYIDFFNNYGFFNLIPVSKKDQKEELIFEKLPHCKRMAIGNRYSEIKRSRYGNDYVIITNKLKSKSLFNFKTFDLVSINNKISELQNKREGNKKRFSEILEEKEGLTLKKTKLKEQCDISHISKSAYNLNRIKKNLEFAERELGQLKDINLQRDVTRKQTRIKELERKALDEMNSLGAILDISNIPPFNLEVIKSLKLDLDNDKRQLMFENHLKSTEEQCYNSIFEKKEKVKAKIEAAKESIRSYPTFDNLEGLPDNLDEIIVEIKTLTARLNILKNQGFDENDYKEKENQLKNIHLNLDELNKIKDKTTNDFEIEKEKIIDQINKFISPINEIFSNMFKRFNFEGKLEVDTSQRDWELRILVKFRKNESLEQLSSFRQSGGEKSLTTVLFLLSLQQCQETSFRLVDEINQGMDPINERIVFEIIRDMGDNSQFFIITPKMVDGLQFSERTKAIIVYGGPGVTKDIEDYCLKALS